MNKLFKREKKIKKNKVEYQVHTKGCTITFKTEDAKRYKHIELCLTGIAKLLNVVEESDDWEKFTALMDAVVEELATDRADIEDEKIPSDYVV